MYVNEMTHRLAAALFAISVAVALAAGLGHAASIDLLDEPRQQRVKHYDPLP